MTSVSQQLIAPTTRAALVTRIAAGWVPPSGAIITADNHRYMGQTSATVITDLPGLVPLPPYNAAQWGCVAYASQTGGTAYTAQLQKAADWVEGDLNLDGWVHIADKLTLNNRCRLNVPEGRAYGGLVVTPTFNMSATCVLRPGTAETAASIGELGIWFSQPDSDDIADMRHYPPALDIADLPRGKIDALRIMACWNGLVGAGNFGGYEIGKLEISAFNEWINVDGALDFVEINHAHVWVFGLTANQITAYNAKPPEGFVGRIDNLKWGLVSLWRAKLRFNDSETTARLPYQIGQVSLDGDGATLSLGDGPSQIGQVYSTKSPAASDTDYDIRCYGLGHKIGSYIGTSDADASILVQSGGDLTIANADLQHLNTGRRSALVQTGGRLEFGTVFLRAHGAAAAARTAEMIAAEGSGVLVVQHIRAHSDVNSNYPLVSFATDQSGNYLDARGVSSAYSFTIPAAPTAGYYNTRTGLPNTPARGDYTVTIADDAVASFNIGGARTASIFVVASSDGKAGMWAARAAASPAMVAMGTITGLTATTGALTGTTGVDGAVTVSVSTAGLYYVENRSGGALDFVVSIAAAMA
jgi:hypothetical protein